MLHAGKNAQQQRIVLPNADPYLAKSGSALWGRRGAGPGTGSRITITSTRSAQDVSATDRLTVTSLLRMTNQESPRSAKSGGVAARAASVFDCQTSGGFLDPWTLWADPFLI